MKTKQRYSSTCTSARCIPPVLLLTTLWLFIGASSSTNTSLCLDYRSVTPETQIYVESDKKNYNEDADNWKSIIHNCIFLCIHVSIDLNISHPITWSQRRQSQTRAARGVRGFTRGPGSRKPFWGSCIYMLHKHAHSTRPPGSSKVPRPQMCSLANYRMLCELASREDKLLKSFSCAVHRDPQEKPRKTSLPQSP